MNSQDNLDYPRLLLINGQAIGQKSGVGKTLANLFRGWPKDRIAQIIPEGSEPDESICNLNFFLKTPGNEKGTGKNNLFFIYLKNKFQRAFGYPITPELLEWVAAFKPELVYSYLELPLITNLVKKLARVFDVKVIPHIMDEWNSAPKGIRLSKHWWFIRQQKNFKTIINQSPFGLAISDEMSIEYQKLFRRPFYTFMNSVNPDNFTSVQQVSEMTPTKLRMVYAGSGWGLGRWPIIRNLAKAVHQLNQRDCQIEFTIFVRKDLFKELPPQGNGVSFLDFLSEDKLAGFLSNSDIAVLPEGFDKENLKYTRLSFSSKIPIYLMAGCCILAIGPLQNNSIKYIDANNLGVTIFDDSFDAIYEKLKELYHNRKLISQFKQRNQEFALENFNQVMIHQKLATLLQSAIGRKI